MNNFFMSFMNFFFDVSILNIIFFWIVFDDGFEVENCEVDQVCGEICNFKFFCYDSIVVEGGYLEAGEYGFIWDWRGRWLVY